MGPVSISSNGYNDTNHCIGSLSQPEKVIHSTILLLYIFLFYIYVIVVVVGPVDKWITLVASDFFMLSYLGVNRLLEPLYPLSQISLMGYLGG